MMTNRVTEQAVAVGYITPQSVSASVVFSDVIPMNALQYGRRFVATAMLGTIGSSASVTGGFYWCATSTGSFVSITGSTITADTVGTDCHVVEISTEQILAFASGANFIKFGMTSATAATTCAAVVWGYELSQNPPNGTIATKTVEVVTGPVSGIV